MQSVSSHDQSPVQMVATYDREREGKKDYKYIHITEWTTQGTDHSPDMKAQAQREVDESDTDGDLEFADQNADQPSLEDEGVEEQKEDDDDRKHNADVLNPATNTKSHLWKNDTNCQVHTTVEQFATQG